VPCCSVNVLVSDLCQYNRRHNAVNYAVFEAVRAVAVGLVLLGDWAIKATQTPRYTSTAPTPLICC
jgi:hypothetical protein